MANENKQREIEQKIMAELNTSLFGMSITEIADKIHINRMTAAKYLEIMHAKKLIFSKKVGTSKLWLPREQALDQRMQMIVEFFKMYNKAVNEKLNDASYEQIRDIGSKIGANVFQNLPDVIKTQKFKDLVEVCAKAMEKVYPIPSLIEPKPIDETSAEVIIHQCLCAGVQEDKSICEMQTGIILGIAKPIFPTIVVEEKKCMCNGDPYCSYHIQYSP
ncbi:MAG: hypothetical protein HWN66_17410 [Candidatus Helarchaeota archaeon]|nr:hypothetical protein [Candidatus Helarchaeota archaeon]